jgi:cytidylate kinase
MEKRVSSKTGLNKAATAKKKSRGPIVSIDGPAGTGKSSASKRLAEALGYIYVDTGALYRAIARLWLDEGPDRASEKRAIELAQSTRLKFKRMPNKNPSNRIFANGEDVTETIRTPEVSMAASKISAIPGVRDALLGLQRKLGEEGRSILEGRDIGTVVFPDADVKFFLTATVQERAKRRLMELEAMGSDPPSFKELKAQIQKRDHMDKTRAVAPLKKPRGAIVINTTKYTLDQVVERMRHAIKKLREGNPA